jgi:CHAT domain-containing protein
MLALLVAGVVAAVVCRHAIAHQVVSFRLSRAYARVIAACDALPDRLSEGRAHGGFAHRPLRDQSKARQIHKPESSGVPSVMLALRDFIARHPGKESARAMAAANLATGRSASAIVELEDLLRDGSDAPIPDLIERSTDAALLSDLACAYLMRATQPDDVLVAAAAVRRAHTVDPTSADVAWNRALVIERLGLLTEARNAWNAYLRVDATSGWADEARARLAALDITPDASRWEAASSRLAAAFQSADRAVIARIAVEFPVRVEAVVERDWITSWSEATARRDPAASRMLAAIDAAGAALQREGDLLIGDFVVAARNEPEVIAAGHRELALAHKSLQSNGTVAAIDALTRVLPRLARSPLRVSVLVEIAGLHQLNRDHQQALQAVAEAEAQIDARRWPLLAARAEWVRGTASTSLGHVSRAARAYTRAGELYRKMHDATQLGMVEMLLGDNAELAGNVAEAWPRYLRAIREVERHGEPARALVILDTFVRAALRRGYVGFAALLNEILLARLQPPAPPAYLCHATITQADILVRLGRAREAAPFVAQARTLWTKLPDETVRRQLEADLEIAAANTVDDAARLEQLSRAVNVSTRTRDLYRLARVLLLRARAYMRSGNMALARVDLEEALRSVEEQRERLDAVPDKLTYFETSRAIAEELVDVHLRDGHIEDALRVVERVRARLLVDRMSRNGHPPASLDDIRARLGAGTSIVEHWTTPDELYLWVVRRDGVHFFRFAAPRALLVAAGRRFVHAMEKRTAWAEDSATLYDALIAPAAAVLATQRLIIVPDEALVDLPYAALRDRRTEQFVVERFAVSIAPSATASIVAGGLPRHTSAVIVANPATATGLPELNVDAEVRAVSELMPRVRVFEGPDARLTVLREVAGSADLLHISTHALADDVSGEPVLALTPEVGRNDGLVPASEIEQLNVRRGGLVVLAACRTARGRSSSDGTLNLARAFLSAGAGRVVAALWNVSDRDTSAFFRQFYRELSTGGDPASALHQAQITILKRHRNAHPQRWAAFQIYGGNG